MGAAGAPSLEVPKRRCGIWGHGLVLGEWSGSITLEGFSKRSGSPRQEFTALLLSQTHHQRAINAHFCRGSGFPG